MRRMDRTQERRQRRGRVAATVLLVMVAAVVVGCGSSGGTSAGPASSPAEPVAGKLTLVAKNLAFAPTEIRMTSATALTVVLDNQDAGVPHNVVLFGANGTKIAATDIVSGVAQAQMSIAPLVPGQYRFSCAVHPTMTATLSVVPAG